MKKVGIVADNYKVDKFRKELTKNGFTDFDTAPFTKDSTTIVVNVADNDVVAVKRICEYVEMHFKRGN